MDLKEPLPEMDPPPFGQLLTPRFYVPFLAYFLLFNVISVLIRRFAWQSYSGFGQYRMQNLTVCVIHSAISGLWCLSVFLCNYDAMFDDIFDWYSPLAEQLPILSIAYFVHDAIHMLKHEWSRWTLELLVHHFATCVALMTGFLPRRFLLADYWALLMEVNSVFLHTRTMMQITGTSKLRPALFSFVVFANIATFIMFRMVAQMTFVHWALRHRHLMHPYYAAVSILGEGVFFIINSLLLMRILAADGYLGEAYKAKIAVNRDAVKEEEKKNE